jgi:hypothetical protein
VENRPYVHTYERSCRSYESALLCGIEISWNTKRHENPPDLDSNIHSHHHLQQTSTASINQQPKAIILPNNQSTIHQNSSHLPDPGTTSVHRSSASFKNCCLESFPEQDCTIAKHKMPSLSSSPLHSQQTSTISPLKRKQMSVTQTYYLAHTARGKLSSEASRADHNLRLLVGHANLLDSLMLELAEAEQEQESWFNQSVKKATKTEEPRHIQWADTIVEDPEEDWQAEDADSSDSESDYDSDEDVEMEAGIVSLQRVSSNITTKYEEVEEEYEDDGEEDFEGLQLHLTQSHSPTSPPELDHDSSDDSSEDESMPPSPPSDILPTFSEKQRQQIATTGYYSKSKSPSIPPSEQEAFFEEGFYLPSRTAPGLISAISVY